MQQAEVKYPLHAEIVAPAGSPESLQSAVVNGANAVYLGIGSFSARAKANLFSLENLSQWVRYCHIYGVKVYLTVNILVKDSEMQDTLSLIERAWGCGIDDVIIQDLGLLQRLNSTLPHIVLHASTQMGIHNKYGVGFAARNNIKRVILSRETTLADIKEIHAAYPKMELEYFVQGALCVCFSGNCYFSSAVSSLSGNRGRCMQLCRKKYKIESESGSAAGYLLSTKDLCLAGRLAELIDAGISSIKIEGRLRRHEYVGEAVRVYRAALSGDIQPRDIDLLKQLFNRGDFADGYLDDYTAKVIFPQSQSHIGLQIGRVSAVNGGVAKITTQRKLQRGDGLRFFRNNQEVGHCEFSLTKENSTTFVGDVRVGDAVNITTSVAQLAEIAARTRSIPVDIDLAIKGDTATLTISADNATVSLASQIVQPAHTTGTTTQMLIESISKLGGTHFQPRNINVRADDANIFLPRAQINALRRLTVEMLEKQLVLQIENLRGSRAAVAPIEQSYDCPFGTIVQVSNKEHIAIVEEYADAISYKPSKYDIEDIEDFARSTKLPVLLSMPPIARSNDLRILEKVPHCRVLYGIVANNVYAIELCSGMNIIMGSGTNIINSYCHLPSIAGWDCAEPDRNSYVCAFSRMPLMTICHCPRNNACAKCAGQNLSLVDEKGYRFEIQRVKVANCYHEILNSNVYCVIDKIASDRKRFFDFAGCDAQAIRHVLSGKLPNPRTSGNFGKRVP